MADRKKTILQLLSILNIALTFVATNSADADTFGTGPNRFNIDFVTIGNPGNPADTTGAPNPAGSVPYRYRIGKYEISEQMIDKANALGNLRITKDSRGPDKPATSITWNEAARFVSWLNMSTGNPPAYRFAFQTDEVGYDANANIELWEPFDVGYDPNNPYRNSLAKYFLPSVHEWYKAAYYDPTSGVYYDYPMGSDSVPDGIDFAGDPNFDVVFYDGPSNAQPNSQPNDITNVGLLSPYGTAGQGGNVYELEETNSDLVTTDVSLGRGARGGNWNSRSGSLILRSSTRISIGPSSESFNFGFRVASSIPEPSTLLLLCFGSLAVLWRRRRLVCASILIVLLASPARTVHAAEIRTVALSGQKAPGTPDGVNFYPSKFPALNDAGQTVFYARLFGDGVAPNGIWSAGSGSLALVARDGDQAPGTPSGANFVLSSRGLVINDAGQTAFRATLTGSGVIQFANDTGIWSEGSGSLALVARTGDQAPGLASGVTFNALQNAAVLNNAGQTAFWAFLRGPGTQTSESIWSEGSGALALVAHKGDQAPGADSGVTFGNLGTDPLLNNAGQTVFLARLTGSGVNATNDQGIWSQGSGSLALVAREGSQAPGVPSGVNFNIIFVGRLAFNNAGQTAFTASLIGGGVDATNNLGIWSEGSGSLSLLARAGDHAPGTPSGVNFGGEGFGTTVLNDAGQTAFFSRIVGDDVDFTNNSGIWLDGSGGLALVARAGDHAPGATSDKKFNSFGDIVLNKAGQIAFEADTAGGSEQGIWATDRNGVVHLIVRDGDLLEVAPGDFRTVNFLESDLLDTGNSDGRASWFNNRGQVVFIASFTDGSSGVFVSNHVAIPEPATLLLAALATFCLVGPCRQPSSKRTDSSTRSSTR